MEQLLKFFEDVLGLLLKLMLSPIGGILYIILLIMAFLSGLLG